jgi:serralysin
MCGICAVYYPGARDCKFDFVRFYEDVDAPDSIGAGVEPVIRSDDEFRGELTLGDVDVIEIDVIIGDEFTLETEAYGTAVEDTYMILYDMQGNEVAFNDDIDVENENYFSSLTFTATETTYYVVVSTYETAVGELNPIDTGEYSLNLTSTLGPPAPNLPTYDLDQIADQLVNGYWQSTGRSARNFDIDVSGGLSATVYVDYSDLNTDGQWFAQQALDVWSAVTGITFSTGAPPSGEMVTLTFDDEDDGAYSSSTTSGGITTDSFINVETDWLIGDEGDLDSSSFETYIHEIGHSLGLGHAGNYNAGSTPGKITYFNNALFLNESVQVSVMSYFSQLENTTLDASGAYLFTPAIADIIAVQNIYGIAGNLRLGDTTYGVGSTAGGFYDDLINFADNMAFVIVDDGGDNDLIDFSTFTDDQVIDLNQEAFSDIGGERGNMAIARGTDIEDAKTGSGNDTLIGNALDNYLTGGLGNDDYFGNGGSDTANYFDALGAIWVSLTQGFATGAHGNDTFDSIENINGTNFDDIITGDDEDNQLEGWGGIDKLNGGKGEDTLYGDNGNDILKGGDDDDTAYGGADDDRLIGGHGNDDLFGNDGEDKIYGGDGNDYLDGGDNDDFIKGNDDDDTIYGDEGNDKLFGNDGYDLIWGGDDDDFISGSIGGGILRGEHGNDTIKGGSGIDEIYGGIGEDKITGGGEADLLMGGDDNDNIQGGSGGDVIHGEDGDDYIDGEKGFDFLYGGADEDTIKGGTGDDFIDGGADDDRLFGDAGADTFFFDMNSGKDWIKDWETGVDFLDLTSFGLADYAAVEALMSQTTNALRITFDANTRISIEGMTAADFSDPFVMT